MKKSLPFLDLKSQQKKIRKKIEKSIKSVLDHGQYIMGPEIKVLEMPEGLRRRQKDKLGKH